MTLGDQLALPDKASTGIVVVFYRPDAACVRRANRYADAGLCVVIDNTEQSQSADQLGLDKRIEYVANGANQGIATGINQGVEVLLNAGCTSALIFDQDSEPSDRLLQELPRLLDEERRQRGRVALIGPAYEDARLGGVAPFVRFGYLKLQRVAPVGTQPIEIDFLISSGSCINLAAWQEIGPMDDALFIDFVDLEWCIRARSRGYAVLGAPGLRLAHELGGEPVRVFGRQYPSHSPLRHYYLFRNAVALIKRSYIPWTWKSTELVKFPFRLAIYGLFLQPRLSHLRMALTGIWHGLTGRMGRLDRP
ncbi:glycosyltransferase family 2 protein [Paraburkholderia sp. LEh10]|uniref:glycosyltransferase family 2 protein n=1 Tax=Paraburkholderia sp. LEh10 TaxID=2821353 RepID=UPI001AE7E5AC|nr:glycosyltransferase family 2 protein [Paraburkholderia sp. LEh10]MBP0593898.1 glycosyltransferase family 2 protein [Paraburkholderia sp. LEh10]